MVLFAEYIRLSSIAGNSIVEDKLKMPPIFPLTEISNPALRQKSLILTWPGGERNQKHLKKYYLVRGYVGAKRNSFELLSFSLSTPWKTQHNQSRTCTTGTKITYLIQYLSLWICWILDKIFSKRYLIGLYL